MALRRLGWLAAIVLMSALGVTIWLDGTGELAGWASDPRGDPAPEVGGGAQLVAPANPYRPALIELPGGAHRLDDERTIVMDAGLTVMRTEVTQAQYAALLGKAPSHFTACGPRCPVESVSWIDAVRYANALSRSEGLASCYRVEGARVERAGLACEGYRLPSLVEWRYAARAGRTPLTVALYAGEPTGRGPYDDPAVGALGWYGGNSAAGYTGAWDCSGHHPTEATVTACGPQPVGRRATNDWGLVDMLGNVAEWTENWSPDVELRCAGGSWFSNAPALAIHTTPPREQPNRSGATIGFRLVRR